MNAIIYSKDRALQCNALLESIKAHLSVFSRIEVIYTTKHLQGYQKLKERHTDVAFIEESNFQRDTLDSIYLSDFNVAMFVDDCIVYRNYTDEIDMLDSLLDYYPIISLRLGRDITHKKHFGYNGSLDGNIYNASYLMDKLEGKRFTNPNKLESVMANAMKGELNVHYLRHSIVKGIPANKVSSSSHCYDMGINVDDLNDLWLEGHRLDWQRMDLVSNNVHKEVNLIDYLIKEDAN